MGWLRNFFEGPMTRQVDAATGVSVQGNTIVIDVPDELYFKELAVYTATSLISNAISKSEIKCFEKGKAIKKEDYFRLNISPNDNETSSYFWHKVINKTIRNGECLVVEMNGKLYCAESFTRSEIRPILGDKYEDVDIGDMVLSKKFSQKNTYLFRLDNINVKALIDQMFSSYESMLKAAAKSIRQNNAKKYKLHISAAKAGDDDFRKEFEEVIKKQLEEFMKSDDAVYPEFDGYELKADEAANSSSGTSTEFTNLKSDMFKTVASAFHIPDSMMTGNINNMKEVISGFLTFGVDPFADMISEALNKGSGVANFMAGNYYKVDTGKIKHRDIVEQATDVSNLISSGTMSINEVLEEFGKEQINEPWAEKHFITKNFEEIERFLNSPEDIETNGKEEKGEKKILPNHNR